MKLKAKPTTIAAALVIAAFVVFVVNTQRGIAPYSWPNIATFLVVAMWFAFYLFVFSPRAMTP